MNKIFKTVRSKATGEISVASEFARGNGKGNARKLLALTALIGLGLSATATAQDTKFEYLGNTTLVGTNSVLNSNYDLIPVKQVLDANGNVAYTYYINQNNQVVVNYPTSVVDAGIYNINPVNVYGGYAMTPNAITNNTSVSVLQGNITDAIYGGYALGTTFANASNGSVTLANNSTVNWLNPTSGIWNSDGQVFGTYATASDTNATADSSYGSVTLTDSAWVYGDVSGSSAATINSGTAVASYGSVSLAGDSTVGARFSSATIYGTEAHVQGQGQGQGTASANNGSVSLTDNSTLWGSIVAGVAAGGNHADASYNTVSVSGNAQVKDTFTTAGMTLGEGDIDGGIANSEYAKAQYNSVTITDNALVEGDVYGGSALGERYSEASENTVTVSGNATLNGSYYTYPSSIDRFHGGSIYGGYVDASNSGITPSEAAFARNNTVNLDGTITLQQTERLSAGDIIHNSSYLYGGFVNYETGSLNALEQDVFSGNTLNFSANAVKVARLGNFENYNFTLNDFNKDAIDKGEALITVTNEIRNDNTITQHNVVNGNTVSVTTPNQSKIQVTGISGTHIIYAGQSVTLIEASQTDAAGVINTAYVVGGYQPTTSNLFSGLFEKDENGNIASNIAQVGLVKQADVSYTIDNEKQSVTAHVDDIYYVSQAVADRNVKPLSEGRLAGLMEVNRGADLLASDVWSSIDNANNGQVSPFVLLEGSHDRYESGSHIKSNSYNLVLGMSYQLDNLTLGGLFEYGHGDYDTYNSFAGLNDVHGSGTTKHYGIGLIGKYTMDDIYFDGSLRFGRNKTDFDTNDIVMGNGSHASYDSKATYIGGHLGGGYVFKLDDAHSFDSSLKFLYTQLGSDDVTLDGDQVRFDKSKSMRFQLAEKWNYKANDYITIVSGLAYEYEMKGKVNAKVNHFNIDEPKTKGSTGIAEFGVIFGDDVTSIGFKVKGYTGKHEGVSGLINASYKF